MRFLQTPANKNRKTLTPLEKTQLAIIGNRLNVTCDEAARLLQDLQQEVAQIMGIPGAAVETDTEFRGRDLDVTFTINKQNTPKKNK